MTGAEIFQEVENGMRELRLTEQKIFRQVLDSKQKKSKRALILTFGVFALLVVAWLCLHCIPLVLNN